MADNTQMSADEIIATDDIGGVKHQRVKVQYGVDGSATDASASNPFPVALQADNLSGDLDVSVSNTVTVTGTVSVADGGGTITVDPNGGTFTVDDGGTTLSIDDGGSTISIDDGGGAITVDGSVTIASGTVTISGAVDTELSAAAALADNTANPTTSLVGAMLHGLEGATWDRITSTSGALDVNIANAVVSIDDNSTTISVDDGGSALTVDGTVTIEDGGNVISIDDGGGSITVDGTVTVGGIAGDVAHDGADSGNPVKIGAVARTAIPTAVADGDRADVFADDLGRLVIQPLVPRDRIVHNRIALTDTTETTLIATGGAGVFRDLIGLYISNESATEVRVDIRDSTTGTIRLSYDIAADGGGVVANFPVQFTQATANNNWTARLSASVSTVYVTAIAIEGN